MLLQVYNTLPQNNHILQHLPNLVFSKKTAARMPIVGTQLL